MKKFVGIALVLALALSTAAMAEVTTDPIPAAEVPAVEAQVPAEEATETPVAEDEQKALKDAMDAYRAAKQDKAVDDLEAELKGYVEAGSLTQEQADLILKNVKERLAAKNGECPNCGYQFSRGGKGRRGGMMGGQRGQQRGQMSGQQRPDAQSGATPQGPMNGQQMPQNGLRMPQNGQQMPQNGQPQIPQNGQEMPLVPQM